jgi:predicted Zn-dependent peptidase
MRKSLILTIAVLMAQCFGQQAAQNPPAAKRTPPAPGPPRPFHFPKYETKKLTNGLTVFVIEDRREPLVSIQLDIATAGGSAVEASKAGLATLTAALLREGTRTRTAQQIAKTIDSSGGSLGSNAGSDTASADCTMMKSSADLGLELLADIVINPTFPQEEVERQMRQTLSGLQVSYSDPQSLAGYLMRRTVFGTHPYAMPVGGTPDTVRKLKRDDIVSFYRAHYAPTYSYLAISGDVTPGEAFAKAEKYFGSWKGTAQAPAIVAPKASATRRIVIVDKPDAVQTQYSIVQVAIPRNDPDYIPLQLANQIFGGSFNSRLNMKLRANEGLTYGANSALEAQRQTGVFAARSFSRTDKTSTAIKMMAGLLGEYRENPVTDAELNDAKAYLAGSFALSVETPEAVAQRVLILAVNGLPANYWDTYRDKILATTAEQVAAAVRRHLTPDRMDIVAVGNAAQFSKDLASLGTVDVIPLSQFDITAPNLRRASEPAAAATGETKARGMKLAQEAADAVGGSAALDAVKNIESKGPMTISMGANSIKGDVDEVVLFPDKYRAAITLPMGTMVQAYDGKIAWLQQGPQTKEAPSDMIKEVQRDIELVGTVGLLRSAVNGKAGMVATGDNTAVWTMGEHKVNVTFDPASKRITKLSYHGMGLQGPADIDVEYADYRKAGDVYLPFHETLFQNGQKFAVRDYTDRQINADVKLAIFAKPDK